MLRVLRRRRARPARIICAGCGESHVYGEPHACCGAAVLQCHECQQAITIGQPHGCIRVRVTSDGRWPESFD